MLAPHEPELQSLKIRMQENLTSFPVWMTVTAAIYGPWLVSGGDKFLLKRCIMGIGPMWLIALVPLTLFILLETWLGF